MKYISYDIKKMVEQRCLIQISMILVSIILFAGFVLAEDISVWQGQYYTGTTFNVGTYDFNFTIYDNKTDGDICFSNFTALTTGSWGEWKTEQKGVGSACNNVSQDYFLEIKINNETQDGRRLLKSFQYLRQDIPVLFNQYNYSGTARWQIKNVNSGNTSNTLFSVTNNIGYLLSFGITSNNYFSVPNNRSFSNQPSIGQSSFNDLYFVNGRQTGFSWFNNPFNDTSNFIQKIMTLDSNGNLNVSGNITTTQTGFFSFLGSLASRVTKLFVQNINVNGTIDGLGNIDLTGNIKTDGNLTVEGDFVLGGDLKLENNLDVDKNISAEQYIADNQIGITNDGSYSACINVSGTACNEWCTLEITGGLITGCS